jgi:general stress protein 26
MGDIQNLQNTEAIEKIRDLATKNGGICMFVTALNKRPQSARPMSGQDVDEHGNIWFFSEKSSDKNQEIKANPEVQLFYANHGSSEYLSVYGEAEIVYDKVLIEKYWTPIAKAWFTEGKDDPEISLIKVKTIDAYYWDTKSNKLVSLIKIAASVVSGKTMDGGVEGSLDV